MRAEWAACFCLRVSSFCCSSGSSSSSGTVTVLIPITNSLKNCDHWMRQRFQKTVFVTYLCWLVLPLFGYIRPAHFASFEAPGLKRLF